MEAITSNKNRLVVLLRSLKDRKSRLETSLMLVEGEKLVREAFAAGLKAETVIMEEEFAAEMEPLLQRYGVKGYTSPRHIIEYISDTKTPQGMCAAFSLPDKLCLDDPPLRIVALDGVQDPGNVGTIWRTADAAGFTGILFGAGSADMYSTKVQRASMGSGLRLPGLDVQDLSEALMELRKKGYSVFASSLQGGDFYSQKIPEKYVLVIGSEARGISEKVASCADTLVKLPMRGGAESLNAAVAAGIMMYEMTKGL